MATISAISISRAKSYSQNPIASPKFIPIQFLQYQKHSSIKISSFCTPTSLVKVKQVSRTSTNICCASEQESATAVADETSTTTTSDQTVSVSVSPSDVLTMFFQAEGTMNEAAIPNVTKALEDVEGITDLKVRVVEGIASVELTKQTTIQATGVASSLVEAIQGSGFKLQTLNLSFQDEEETTS